MLDIVDENDKVIGQALKSECHKKGLKHRCVAIIVMNKKGEILIQKRSPETEECPNKLCISASGHVAKGEDYPESATRELKEELGVTADLKLIGSFPLFNSDQKYGIEDMHVKLFQCQWDKQFKFNDGEVSEAKFFTQDKLKKMIEKNSERFNQASVTEFKHFFNNSK